MENSCEKWENPLHIIWIHFLSVYPLLLLINMHVCSCTWGKTESLLPYLIPSQRFALEPPDWTEQATLQYIGYGNTGEISKQEEAHLEIWACSVVHKFLFKISPWYKKKCNHPVAYSWAEISWKHSWKWKGLGWGRGKQSMEPWQCSHRCLEFISAAPGYRYLSKHSFSW